MRVVFMGTPDFAVPALQALLDAGHQVAGVFTQPDKPVGRHQNKLQPPPVKVRALEHGIPVYQPTKLRDGSALALLRELDPDLIAVAAYGRILPDDILALPSKGCINVHSSLLPKYRGAAPINWAVVNGETQTGVTIMHMASELDAGDIILQRAIPIGPDEGVESVHDRLAALGGELLVEALARLEDGTAPRIPQDAGRSCYAPMLSKALSPVDWTRHARAVHDQIRALSPWPCAETDLFRGVPTKLHRALLLPGRAEKAPGSVAGASKEGIDVVCGDGGLVRILELQESGKRRMTAEAWLAGHALPRG